MAGEPGNPGGTRVLIIEDGLAALRLLRNALGAAMGPNGERVGAVQFADHSSMLDPMTTIDHDLVLVDAHRHPNDRAADPGVSLLAGMEIAQRIQDRRPETRVIAYSAHAQRPGVNISFRQVPVVRALYDVGTLHDNMAEAAWSSTFEHQVAPPSDSDFAALGLLPGARVWEAMQLAMARPDTWEAVARTRAYQGLEKRTRDYLNARVGPLLPTPRPVTYRHYVEVLREIAGFGG